MTNSTKANQILNNVINNDVTESIKTPANVFYIYAEDSHIVVEADKYCNGVSFINDKEGQKYAEFHILDILRNNLPNC